MRNTMMGHGEILDLLLKHKKMTIATLAKKSEVPQTTLYTIRTRNSRGTNVEIIKKICTVLRVPTDIFLRYSSSEVLFFITYGSSEPDKSDSDAGKIIDLKNLMEDNNITAAYLASALQCLGFKEYTEDYVIDILSGKIELNSIHYDLMIDISENETLLSTEELHLIRRIFKLPKESRDLLLAVLEQFEERNTYFKSLYFNDKT